MVNGNGAAKPDKSARIGNSDRRNHDQGLTPASIFKRQREPPLSSISMRKRIFTRENLLALFICLLAILLLIVATDSAPQWIYQGF